MSTQDVDRLSRSRHSASSSAGSSRFRQQANLAALMAGKVMLEKSESLEAQQQGRKGDRKHFSWPGKPSKRFYSRNWKPSKACHCLNWKYWSLKRMLQSFTHSWWHSIFDARIESHTVSDADRLYHLSQHLEGDPKELIGGCLYMDTTAGYNEARLNVNTGILIKLQWLMSIRS